MVSQTMGIWFKKMKKMTKIILAQPFNTLQIVITSNSFINDETLPSEATEFISAHQGVLLVKVWINKINQKKKVPVIIGKEVVITMMSLEALMWSLKTQVKPRTSFSNICIVMRWEWCLNKVINIQIATSKNLSNM